MSLLLTRMFDPQASVAALREAGTMLSRHRALVMEMTRRELKDRYAGSAFGAFWALAAPLLMFGSNVFAMMYIMRIRYSPTDSGLLYAMYVLTGTTAWVGVAEAISRAPSVILGSSNLVKQVVFPSEVLPMKLVLASLPSVLIGLVLVAVLNVINGSLPLTILLAPICILYQLILVTGLVYALAALGVFLKDIKEFTAVLLSVGLFLHPIFYPPGAIPDWVATVFLFSPVSHLIWCFHDAFFYGEFRSPWSWLITPLAGLFLSGLGWRVFRTLRPTFGNAL